MVKWTKSFSENYLGAGYWKVIEKKTVISACGNVKGKKILDIGCGNGSVSRDLAKRSAAVFGIDKSKEQIKLAEKTEHENPLGINYILHDFTKPYRKPLPKFDIALLNYVIIEIPERHQIGKILHNANAALKRNGKLIIFEKHPCNHDVPSLVDRAVYEKPYVYFKSGQKIVSAVSQFSGGKIKFENFHWTLEDFSKVLEKNNFYIEKIREPKPADSDVKKYEDFITNETTHPFWILLEARKM